MNLPWFLREECVIGSEERQPQDEVIPVVLVKHVETHEEKLACRTALVDTAHWASDLPEESAQIALRRQSHVDATQVEVKLGHRGQVIACHFAQCVSHPALQGGGDSQEGGAAVDECGALLPSTTMEVLVPKPKILEVGGPPRRVRVQADFMEQVGHCLPRVVIPDQFASTEVMIREAHREAAKFQLPLDVCGIVFAPASELHVLRKRTKSKYRGPVCFLQQRHVGVMDLPKRYILNNPRPDRQSLV
mmetsp:Transcript_61346/g.163064  ORF Transcript_61346/g.163064 Transcript_61346/m.163064 type:complete len:247 (+) Transcript_61346:430-1170(+)